jgi:predicted MFS family arabinose efflux permease
MPSAPPSTRALVAGLAVTQTVAWGVLYYAFAVLLVPMQDDLGWSRGLLVGGFTMAIVVSGLAAPVAGRAIDSGHARALMSGGSVLAVAAVALWAAARSPFAYYGAWLGIGVAMASVLYEPAFTVLAKRTTPHHRRAITTVTLIAGCSSLIFQPFTGLLEDHVQWRAALVVLGAVLAATAIPLHLTVLRPSAPEARPDRSARQRPAALGEPRFWQVTAALAAVTAASMATGVLLVAYLHDRGWTLGRAALAGGTLGIMQLPGRLAYGSTAQRLPLGRLAAVIFLVPAVGIVLLLASNGSALVWLAVSVIGLGQGATTLLRAMVFVDLYGTREIGVLNGISGRVITVTRALAPLVATLVATAVGGYTIPFLGLVVLCIAAASGATRVLRARSDSPAVAPALPM